MAGFIKQYGGYIEIGAYILAAISVCLPFLSAQTFMGTYSASYIHDSKGVCILIFSILSAVIVGINTFGKTAVENFKNDNKSNAKIIQIFIEVIPLVFTFISLILFLVTAMDLSNIPEMYRDIISYAVGFYFLLVALVLAIVLRILQIISNKVFSSDNKEATPATQPAANESVTVQVNN
ncbi:hypothetical protein PIROE2DRAFT_64051 [Piromyces sp. E2]|nr:hypothetical protein PIROE2DRAFT_64051 [Piromyces sp. E2]|eukprot:OUM58999.1 hypothetical protein PIROE2DRAFT_64051 [Piromyces sp. E2]